MKKSLIRKSSQLNKAITRLERIHNEQPDGKIYACFGRGQFHYYQKTDSSVRLYLSSTSDIQTIKALATKEYCNQMIKAAKSEKEAIDKLIEFYNKNEGKLYQEIGKTLNPAIVEKVDNLYITDDEYAEWWQKQPYEHKAFREDDTTAHYTDRGERVRSKSEVFIANTLNKLGVPYRYECKLQLANGTVIFPDFTILDKRTREVKYHEHCGKIGDRAYSDDVARRINMYSGNGIILGKNLFLSCETLDVPLDTNAIRRQLAELYT